MHTLNRSVDIPAAKGMRPATRTGRLAVRAAAVAPPDYDLEISGLKHLPPGAREIATQKKINPFEKVKNRKCGSRMWTEVHELSAKLREGTHTFEDLELDDVDVRLKWAGLFHRKKRKPGSFMMRLKVCALRAAVVYCWVSLQERRALRCAPSRPATGLRRTSAFHRTAIFV